MDIMWGYVVIIFLMTGLILIQDKNHADTAKEYKQAEKAYREDIERLQRRNSHLANEAAWNFNEARHLREALEIKTKEHATALKILEMAENNPSDSYAALSLGNK